VACKINVDQLGRWLEVLPRRCVTSPVESDCEVKADSSLDVAETGDDEKTPENTGENGGSAWESNPPAARFTHGPTILKTVATTRCASTSLIQL
jgi:hypothetical protein